MRFLNGLMRVQFDPPDDGHVFESRFYPKVIEDQRYLATAIRYVVSNPVRASLCASARDWNWSSHHAVIGVRSHRAWFDRAGVLALFGDDESEAIEQYVAFVDEVVDSVPPWDAAAQSRRRREDMIMRASANGATVPAIALAVGASTSTVRRVIRSAANHPNHPVPGTR
jgi:hypothetical protein